MLPQKTTLIIIIILFFAAIPSSMAAQVSFAPTLSLSEEYTDNLFLAFDDESEDYITTVGFGLNGQLIGRTTGLELTYNPSYSKFEKNEDSNNWRHEASLYTWKEVKRNTRLEFRNTYLYTNNPSDQTAPIDPDDPSQRPVIESDTNRRGRNEYYINSSELRLSHQFGSSDNLYFAYQYSILRDEEIPVGGTTEDNDILSPSAGFEYNFTTRWAMDLNVVFASTNFDDVNENDRDEFNGNIRFLHNFNRTLSAFIGYQHTIVDFDQVPDFTVANSDIDYRIHRPSIGIRISFRDNASITIDGGYYVQEFETPQDPSIEPREDEQGFNVASDIYKRWEYQSGYFGINGGSGYEIDDDGSEDNGLTIYYEGGIILGYRFTPRVSSNISCSYRYEDFPNETPNRVDKTMEARASIDWQALEWMSIGLSYSYSDVTSDDPTNEYIENSAMITISMSPSSPYRMN